MSTFAALLVVLSDILATLSLVGWSVTFASTLATFYLVALHWRLRAGGLARERALLAQPLPADEALPDVVVQIPVYNEGPLVARALHAAIAMEWPREKLHIQILDDSTDGSTDLARREVAAPPGAGPRRDAVHRTDRSDFKAGALANAMSRTRMGLFRDPRRRLRSGG